MMEIPIQGEKGKGKVALVDDEDFIHLKGWKWHLETGGYPAYSLKTNGKNRNVSMHRAVLWYPKGVGLVIDHIDRNPLNNQKANLRIVTSAQNSMNIGIPPFSKFRQKYIAHIPVGRRTGKGDRTTKIERWVVKEPKGMKAKSFRSLEEAIKYRDENIKSIYLDSI